MRRDVFLNGTLLRPDSLVKRDYCWAKGVLLLHFKCRINSSPSGPPSDVFTVHTYFLGLRVGTKELDGCDIGFMDYTTQMKESA